VEDEKELIKIRKIIINLAYYRLEYKITYKDCLEAMKVEHYFQNERLVCVSLNEFVPKA